MKNYLMLFLFTVTNTYAQDNQTASFSSFLPEVYSFLGVVIASLSFVFAVICFAVFLNRNSDIVD